MPAHKPYRPCVGIMLINDSGRIFVARRLDTPDAWQMPQGGIDAGETPREAALRELKEETGTASAKLVGEASDWMRYDLPPKVAGKIWKGRYRGQAQKWFAFRFTGRDEEFDLTVHKQEFDAWRWATPAEVLDKIVPFKLAVYQSVLKEFSALLK